MQKIKKNYIVNVKLKRICIAHANNKKYSDKNKKKNPIAYTKIKKNLHCNANKTEGPSVPAAGIGYNYVKGKPKKCQGKDK